MLKRCFCCNVNAAIQDLHKIPPVARTDLVIHRTDAYIITSLSNLTILVSYVQLPSKIHCLEKDTFLLDPTNKASD